MKLVIDKSEIRRSLTSAINQVATPYRRLTSSIRVLPDFIIIGVQKGGTTSLYKYMVQQKSVIPAFRKEVHFFDDPNFEKGICWYRSQFPSSAYKDYQQLIHREKTITGEASPYYIFHPHVPRRIYEMIPSVKLIALLRNPIDRAYSHYYHNRRERLEPLSFAEAVAQEPERIRGEWEKMLVDENYYSYNYKHYSYLKRGIYIEQIEGWRKIFPKEQMLIIKTEDLNKAPEAVFQRVREFLGMKIWSLPRAEKYNKLNYQPMETQLRNSLIEYYKPHNQRLSERLGLDLDWDR